MPAPDVDYGETEPPGLGASPRTEPRRFPRLCQSTLDDLPPTVRRPRYDRSKLSIGLVHIGVGAFHRCHQQEMLDDLLHLRDNERWGECGINLRSPDLGEMLGPQHGLYGRILCDGDARDVRVLGGIVKTIDALPGRSADHIVRALSDPDVKVISLTITEKGYCHHPATSRLDRQHVDLRADVLALQRDPHAERVMLRTAPAYLLASLARRRAHNDAVPTFMSCDNVPDNGSLLGSVVAELADEVAPTIVGTRRTKRPADRRVNHDGWLVALPVALPRAVAQLVEHRSPKPTVGGSSPSCPAHIPMGAINVIG